MLVPYQLEEKRTQLDVLRTKRAKVLAGFSKNGRTLFTRDLIAQQVRQLNVEIDQIIETLLRDLYERLNREIGNSDINTEETE